MAAIDDVAAGYEVHVNLSPVVVRDGWLEDCAQLLDDLADATGPAFRQQAAAEVVFLTQNDRLHEVELVAPEGRAGAVAARAAAGVAADGRAQTRYRNAFRASRCGR